MTVKKKDRPRLLSSSRPRNCRPTPSLSSQATRKLVRTHHTLRKQLSSALSEGNESKAEVIRARIDASGGLRKYQLASIQGQSAERGGDTSKVLMQWLAESNDPCHMRSRSEQELRMLEVGAVRTDNACSKSGKFVMERIDLLSQHPDIQEQDFMTRPLPTAINLDEEGFDLVSLSLVVNFVGDPAQKGEMLKRVGSFLRPYTSGNRDIQAFFPSLFFVLPAPCVTNSRYLDEERLEGIMASLGYRRLQRKLSSKLIYYLWKYEPSDQGRVRVFKKEEVRSGRSRNNFAIVLR